jgi:hypothetical protein
MPGNDIKNVVVRVATAKAGGRLDEAQPLDDLGARQSAARNELFWLVFTVDEHPPVDRTTQPNFFY